MILSLEKQVTSLEPSKRIKELGFPQDGCQWYWVEIKHKDGSVSKWTSAKYDAYWWLDECGEEQIKLYAAPTVAEWGMVLPAELQIAINGKKERLEFWKLDYKYCGCIGRSKEGIPLLGFSADLEADVRAQMYEYIKVKKLLEVKI